MLKSNSWIPLLWYLAFVIACLIENLFGALILLGFMVVTCWFLLLDILDAKGISSEDERDPNR